jgi:hypothetical protein
MRPQSPSQTPTAPPPSLPSLPPWAKATLDRLLANRPAPADRFWAHPEAILTEGLKATPDHWQADLLRHPKARTLLLCSRQSGKSTVAAALALREALLVPGSLVLLLSPTLRQSGELFRDKTLRLYNALKRPVPALRETQLTLELTNGSRVVSLPGEEGGIRGYSGVGLLVLDEAARVPDELLAAVRPMLAVSKGRLVALSTPFGKRGWFWQEWEGEGEWERVKVTADQCPRISAEFLAAERQALGERWFRQEYECSFEETIDSVFSAEDIAAATAGGVDPLWG